MADVLPVNFPIPGESSIASYNYTDIAEGTGIVSFYGAIAGVYPGTLANLSFILTTNQVYSEEPTRISPGAMTFKLAAFNTPKTIKGTAYASIPIYEASAGEYYVKVQVQKDSGGSVSNCSSEISGTPINGNGAHKMDLIPIALTTTHFKKGDILQIVVTPTGGGAGDEEIGIDPQGRAGNYINSSLTSPPMTTQMKFFIPFKLDL